MTRTPGEGLHRPATYAALTLQALRRFGDREALRQDGRSLSYAQARDLLARMVAVLADHDLGAQRGVGVLSSNRPEVPLVQVAPGFLGSRYTALHPLGSREDHLHMCEEAGLSTIVVDPPFAERAAELLEESPAVERVLTLGPCDVGEDLLALCEAVRPARLEACEISPDAVAWLLYTGGTTGKPKAVELTQRAVGAMALMVPVAWDIPRGYRYLACAPITHAASLLVTPALVTGGSVVLQKGWDPAAWLDAVAAERADVALLVPAMIYSLLDHDGLESADCSSLRTVMYGAAPIAPARLSEAIDRVGPLFCQLYGQTECMGLITSLWKDDHLPGDLERLGSCGAPIPGADVRILDADGRELDAGEAGEICVRGPHVMNGYWRQPEQTAEALAGGWLHTGDIGMRDDDGFVHIVDRKKDMIVTGGYNVFPREIEDVLMRDPSIAAAAVIGVPHDKWGEAVTAVVVPRAGQAIDADALAALVKQHKGSIQAPKRVEVVDELPLTSVGKVDKKALRARYWPAGARAVG